MAQGGCRVQGSLWLCRVAAGKLHTKMRPLYPDQSRKNLEVQLPENKYTPWVQVCCNTASEQQNNSRPAVSYGRLVGMWAEAWLALGSLCLVVAHAASFEASGRAGWFPNVRLISRHSDEALKGMNRDGARCMAQRN